MSPESPLDNELRLAPEDGPSRDELERDLNYDDRPMLPLADVDHQQIDARRKRVRFTLREILAMTTFVAIGVAGVGWLPPGWFAGLCGLALLAMLLILIFVEDLSRGFRLFLFAFSVVYAAAVVTTFIVQSH